MRIRDYDVKLVADEERVDGAELFCPFVKGHFRELRQVRETEEGAGRDWIAVLVDDIFAK